MTKTGRPPTCTCGECRKCKHAAYMREWYRRKTPEERQAWYGRRDIERVLAADAARYYGSAARRESSRKRSQEWAEAHPEILREKQRQYRLAYPEKHRAHEIVANALRTGRLTRRPCEVCGEARAEGHHDDYSKPLDVRWLCRAHHMELHRKRKVPA